MYLIGKYWLAFLFIYNGHIAAITEQAWKPTESSLVKDLGKFEADANQRKKEAEAQKAEAEKKKDSERINKEDLKIKQADYDLFTADRKKAEDALATARQTKNQNAIEQQQKKINEAVKEQQALLNKIGQLQEQLRPKDIGKIINDLTLSKNPAEFESFVNSFDDVLNTIDQEQNTEKKQTSIDTAKEQINKVRDILELKITNIERRLKSDPKSVTDKEKQQYSDEWLPVAIRLEDRSARLNAQEANLVSKRVGLFEGAARKVKDFFKRIFNYREGALVVPEKENEINTLVTKISAIQELKPVQAFIDTMDSTVQSLEANVKNLSDEVSKVQTPVERKLLQERAHIVSEALVALETSQLATLDEVTKYTDDFTKGFALVIERYRGAYDTLFDKLVQDYTKELQKPEFSTKVPVDKAYEALGLLQNASPEQVAEAWPKKIAELTKMLGREPTKAEYDSFRNAWNIIGNPVSRATYDAFLQDYNALEKRGVDPLASKKNQDTKDFLNKESASSKLEIGQGTYDRIHTIAPEITVKRVEIAEAGTSFKDRISALREELQNALKASTVPEAEGLGAPE